MSARIWTPKPSAVRTIKQPNQPQRWWAKLTMERWKYKIHRENTTTIHAGEQQWINEEKKIYIQRPNEIKCNLKKSRWPQNSSSTSPHAFCLMLAKHFYMDSSRNEKKKCWKNHLEIQFTMWKCTKITFRFFLLFRGCYIL